MTSELKERIVAQIADLMEDASLISIQQAVDDDIPPLEIIDCCHQGVIQVGERYAKGRYGIAGLIMAGEIMRQVGQLVFPNLKNKFTAGENRRIVLGTVEGDIHDIGKDIFKVLVRGYGFSVHDLGVDVAPSKFLSAVLEVKPDIVGFSCLISAVVSKMQETLSFLKENTPAALAPRAYIIGGRVDRHIAKHVGTDYWANDAMAGVRLCRKIMETTSAANKNPHVLGTDF